MARSVSRTRVITVERYYWPVMQFMLWRFIMLATGGVVLGVFASFINIQQTLGVGIPWLFPFGVTVGALTIIYIIVLEIMMNQNNLQPGLVMLGGFILLVLFITGLIETAIQLFGPAGNVNGNCQNYIVNQPVTGVSIDTLAWLEQHSICQSWDAAFAFWIVGAVFLVWIIIMASQVNRRGAY